MEVFILLVLIVSMIGVMYTYQIRQNSRSVIGGKISKAKTFWLGYAMFHYFILPWWLLLFIAEDKGMEFSLFTILCIFYFRMLIQMLLMFVTRTWSPPIGMAYNILASIGLLYLLVTRIIESYSMNNCMLIVYICILILILLTDTYYARHFYHLVGHETKGKTAIWFASDDEKFRRINRITARNNVIFISLSLVLLLFLLIYALH